MYENSIPKKRTMFCSFCGEEIDKKEGYCPRCGVNLANIPELDRGNETHKIFPQGQTPPSQEIRCVRCKGTGFCQFCHGAGSIHKEECMDCGGTGRCSSCKGTGRIKSNHEQEKNG